VNSYIQYDDDKRRYRLISIYR